GVIRSVDRPARANHQAIVVNRPRSADPSAEMTKIPHPGALAPQEGMGAEERKTLEEDQRLRDRTRITLANDLRAIVDAVSRTVDSPGKGAEADHSVAFSESECSDYLSTTDLAVDRALTSHLSAVVDRASDALL